MDSIVVSVSEAAKLLGVSDDLVYELTARGDLPCVRFGRRKVIPRRAIELVVEAALAHFDATRAVSVVVGAADSRRQSHEPPAA
jgi:excisionase family DNA binding protein